jgi:thioredoxin-related protein
MRMLTFAALALFLTLPVATLGQVTAPATKPDAKKVAIYDEKADAKVLVETALKSAKRFNKRVLIQWGGNWCSWCVLLHDRFKADKDLAKTLLYEYDVVHIDSNNNMDLAAKFGADLKKNGVPFLTVLDADGKVVVNEPTEPFETKVDGKPGHDSKKLKTFLTAHEATPLKAEDVLAGAKAEAAKSERMVFLHFGAPWCGWCHKLNDWLVRPEIATLFGKDFVEIEIDVDRMPGGKEMLAAYPNSDKGGIPWFVMLDAQGKALATSHGAKGNIGFPYSEDEIAHFVTMLQTCKRRLVDQDIETLRKSLVPPPKQGGRQGEIRAVQ